jgi:hypothetical protein
MLADDPQYAFPGQGQLKPEQLEITRLRRDRLGGAARPSKRMSFENSDLSAWRSSATGQATSATRKSRRAAYLARWPHH